MQWTVRKVIPEDIPYLAENLRKEDKDEIRAATGETPYECLSLALTTDHADGPWVGVYKNKPELIFGLYTQDKYPGVGYPWMFCTDKLKQSPREFQRRCKHHVQEWLQKYPLLTNCVYEQNTQHMRWIAWCGFKFYKRLENHGVNKEAFWQFVMTREKE